MNKEASILSVRFVGEGISPDSFSAKELGELLIDLQKSMSAIATFFGDKKWSDSAQILSLVNVENNSNSLGFRSFYPQAPKGYSLMIEAANEKHLHMLPRAAFVGMNHISKLTQKKKCNAELSSKSLPEYKKGIITPKDTLIVPEEVLMTDIKTFYGEITRIGGTIPKVRFRTFGGGLEDGFTSKELARKIGDMLYTTVKIKTEIKWAPETSEIQEIKILDAEPFEVKSNSVLFDGLRGSLKEYSKNYGSDKKGLLKD